MTLTVDDLLAERADGATEDVHFPRALVRAVLAEFSSPGAVVLDPFAGYGTTVVVSEEMGRSGVGIELLPERVQAIRSRVGAGPQVIEGDARRLAEFALGDIDLCLTSPPYMASVDHPENPLTGYRTLDGSYDTYLDELTAVFAAVRDQLRPGGHLVVNAANVRAGPVVTPLAWDLGVRLSRLLTFRGETYLQWDRPMEQFSGDYLLVFEKA